MKLDIDVVAIVREAVRNVRVEIEAGMAEKVAVELRLLGWVCIPPNEKVKPGRAEGRVSETGGES